MNRKQYETELQDPPPAYSTVGGYAQQQQYGNPHQYAGSMPPGSVMNQPIPKGGVVLAQPGVQPTQVVMSTVIQSPPPDHLIFNIFMTLFCCWPIGIFAIIKSLACREAINRGDTEQAMLLSREARRFGYWTLGVGIFMVTVSIVMMFVVYSIYIPSMIADDG